VLLRIPHTTNTPSLPRAQTQQTQLLAADLRHRIQSWDKPLPQGSQLLRSGRVNLMGEKRKIADRHVFLFDSVVVMCKLNKQPHEYQYRLKETFPTRNLVVADAPDTVDAACAFQVRQAILLSDMR